MDSIVDFKPERAQPLLHGGVVDWENDPLADRLVALGKLREHELRQVLAMSTIRNEALGIALTKFGLLSEEDLASVLSELTGLNVLSEQDFQNIESVPEELPTRFLKSVHALPLGIRDGKLLLVLAEPRDIETINSISVVTGHDIEPQLGVCSHIREAIDTLDNKANEHDETSSDDEALKPAAELEDFDPESLDVAHLRDLASEAPTISTVNNILQEAIRLNASDIHFETGIGGLRVRYRVDGVLRVSNLNLIQNAAAITSRIKIMAQLDIAERRLPQDGRIQVKITGKELDIRVSTIPTLFGENIVIRILDKSNVVLDFEHLGFDKRTLDRFRKVLSIHEGIFLVTGPTGCGKTTTLYTALNHINSVEKKLMTVEDPVEYQLEGVNQIAVQPKIGLTFDRVLRSFLRQDPDIIMVGEMRDKETARVAVQAALTGHLVLSTLHTNDAVTGITRLLDMGIEDYLVASTLNGVLAQRLIRRLCEHCKKRSTARTYEAVGCEHCGHSGYSGRIAITELLVIDDNFRELITSRASRAAMQEAAKKAGMKTLRESGMALVRKGITSKLEVLKVVSEA